MHLIPWFHLQDDISSISMLHASETNFRCLAEWCYQMKQQPNTRGSFSHPQLLWMSPTKAYTSREVSVGATGCGAGTSVRPFIEIMGTGPQNLVSFLGGVRKVTL